MIYIVGAVDGGGARAVVTSTGDYRWPDDGVCELTQKTEEEEEEPYLQNCFVSRESPCTVLVCTGPVTSVSAVPYLFSLLLESLRI